MDICCSLCGEPWNHDYVRHELHPTDRRRFLAGVGCESCDFGASCPPCSGTGQEKFDRTIHPASQFCESCLGARFLIVRQPADTPRPERWEYGFHPRARAIEDPEIIFRYRPSSTRDGLVRNAKALCPTCRETAPTCRACAGSGRLQSLPGGDLLGARSELEASDEDSIKILARRFGP